MTTNLLALAQHKIYLQSRIALLVQKHADYKAKEHETPESDHKLTLNSSAACIWDAKCEMEAALDNLEKVRKATYPFTVKRLTIYETSKPEIIFQPAEGGQISVEAEARPEGDVFDVINYLLSLASKMSTVMAGEHTPAYYEHVADDALQPLIVLKGEQGENLNCVPQKSSVFDLLANATNPQNAHISDEVNNRVYGNYPAVYPATSFAPIPTDVSKDIVEPANTVHWKEPRTIGNAEQPIIPDTEGKVMPFIVEPDESNSNIGHDD